VGQGEEEKAKPFLIVLSRKALKIIYLAAKLIRSSDNIN
jgi:hypothetical protein